MELRQYKNTTIFKDCEIEDIKDMEVRPDDTWVLSHPRSGTTLTQEIVYLLKTNLDFKTARTHQMDDRFPFLDVSRRDLKYFRGLTRISEMESPRMIKSHLHKHLLPSQLLASHCKKVYVMRNPKDVFVSCFMLAKYFRQAGPGVTADEFVQLSLFGTGKAYGSPWWMHVRDFLSHSDNRTLLILKYENIVKDMKSAVQQIARHLEVSVTEDDVDRIVDHCQFDNMKQHESTNAVWQTERWSCDTSYGGHIRKGQIGNWRKHISEESSQKVDDMVADKLSHFDVSFDYGS